LPLQLPQQPPSIFLALATAFTGFIFVLRVFAFAFIQITLPFATITTGRLINYSGPFLLFGTCFLSPLRYSFNRQQGEGGGCYDIEF